MNSRGKRQSHLDTTPFDDVFRTVLESAPHLIIPLINETFHKNYDPDSALTQYKNEHVLHGQRIVTDSHLYVGELSVENHHYHFECQSRPDGDIEIRMIEYDFYIAFEGLKKCRDEKPLKIPKKEREGSAQDDTVEDVYRMDLPASAILHLRHTRHTPDRAVVRIYNARGDFLDHIIPIIKIQKYTIEEIVEKRLLLFFPYYLLRYEKQFREIEQDEE